MTKTNMVKSIVFLLLCFGSLTLVQGHHNNRVLYDYDTIIDIEGVVTEVWYVNPHSRVYVEVTNENGDMELWECDLLDRGTLDRRGWKYNDLVAGDYVVVSGRPARNGSFGLMLTKVFRPSDGWVGEGYRGNSG
jgi:hypothetical protein